MHAAGSNSCAQLGIGSTDDVHTLTPCRTRNGAFPEKGRVSQLVSNSSGTLAIVDSGELTLWSTGRVFGASDVFEQVDVGMLLKEVGVCGSYVPVHVAAAWDCAHIVLRPADGACEADILLAVGSHNEFGQLGIGREPRPQSSVHVVDFGRPVRITHMGAGLRHVAVAVSGGDIFGWGDARHGQLGARPPAVKTPQRVSRVVHWMPVRVATSSGAVSALALGRGSTLVAWDGEPARVLALGPVSLDFERTDDGCYMIPNLVALGSCWGTVVCIAGNPPRVHCSGLNTHFQCAGDGRQFSSPVLACGTEHALVNSDCVYAWGWNEHGNLAQGDTRAYTDPVVLTRRATGVFGGCGSSFVDDAT